jgi:hypothetical protein
MHGANHPATWTVGIFRNAAKNIVRILSDATAPVMIEVTASGIRILDPDGKPR